VFFVINTYLVTKLFLLKFSSLFLFHQNVVIFTKGKKFLGIFVRSKPKEDLIDFLKLFLLGYNELCSPNFAKSTKVFYFLLFF